MRDATSRPAAASRAWWMNDWASSFRPPGLMDMVDQVDAHHVHQNGRPAPSIELQDCMMHTASPHSVSLPHALAHAAAGLNAA